MKLVGTDLSGANPTFAWFIRACFDRANLRAATLQAVVMSEAMDNTADQAASFAGANLSGTSTTMQISFDDMRGASIVRAACPS